MSETDLRYDVAAVRAFAANLVAMFDELRRGGMTRAEALEVICTWVRAVASGSSS